MLEFRTDPNSLADTVEIWGTNELEQGSEVEDLGLRLIKGPTPSGIKFVLFIAVPDNWAYNAADLRQIADKLDEINGAKDNG